MVEQLQEIEIDPLSTLLRSGARELITQTVETELELLLKEHRNLRLEDGRQAMVRNGYLPKRIIQTGMGDVEIKVPKVRDRSCSVIHFNSALLPPYLKRTQSVEDLLPWLYLKGISTGDHQEALVVLLGENAQGLSSNTICRLKAKWQEEHCQWSKRDLKGKNYVYIWADGIYCDVLMEQDKLCLLVIISVTADGKKELITVDDGYRESTVSWVDVLQRLKHQGLTHEPKLAIVMVL